jgi:hypothetical protein
MCIIYPNLQRLLWILQKNACKLFKSDDCHSSNGANEANVVPNNKTLMSPTWVGPFG